MKFKTLKASVAIVALVTSSILVLLSLMLIQIVHFSQFNLYRFSRKMAAQWFLEGRMNETLDRIVNEGVMLRAGDFPYTEKINGKDQTYRFQISALSAQNWKIRASMLWQKEIPVEEEVVIHWNTDFGKILVFGSTHWKISKATLTVGSMVLKEPLTVHFDKGISWQAWTGKEDEVTIFPGVYVPAKWIGGDKKSLVKNFFDNSSEIKTRPEKMPHFKILQQKDSFADYNIVLRNYRRYFDASWVIEDAGFYTTRKIVNYLDVYKQKVDDGNGYRTEVIVGEDSPDHLYVSAPSRTQWRKILSINDSYAYGEVSGGFLWQDLDKVILRASSEKTPQAVDLPPDAYRDLGVIYLRGKGWSLISRYEKPDFVAFNEVSLRARYHLDQDFMYVPKDGSCRFTSQRFFKKFVRNIGKGTGAQYTFALPGIHGSFGVYVNGKRVKMNSRDQVSVTLEHAPPQGSDVFVWIYPSLFFLTKKPPSSYTSIYRDSVTEAVELNFDSIQNYPTHSVIYSKLPLYLTGTVQEKLVVLCDQDVYFGAVNRDGKGSSILVVSRTGVWGILPDEGKLVSHHIMIVSPLDTFPVINSSSVYSGGKASLFGSLILTGVEKGRVMDVEQEFPNLIADSQVKRDAFTFPFSVFPFSVKILSVQRH